MDLAIPMGAVRRVAARLYVARLDRQAIPPVRHELPQGDLQAAYAVQQANVERALGEGRIRAGRKIGLTSKAVQRQLGVNQPDFGVLFEDMAHRGDDVEIDLKRLISPRIEAEIALVLRRDIASPGLGRAGLADSVGAIAAAAEIVDSAIAGWDIEIVDTIADNASCGVFALGSQTPFAPAMNLAACRMRLFQDGDLRSEGAGSATLGDPLNALAWLAETAIALGDPLRAGEVVLAGALGPMIPLEVGAYRVEIDGLEPLTVRVRS